MGFAEGFQAGSLARARRDELRMGAEQRNQELMKQGYSFENGGMQVRDNSAAQAEQLQAQEAAQLSKALQGKLAAQATDNAFDDFANTGDANYLQKALDNEPVLKQAWAQKGVQLIQNIDFGNDKTLLANAGMHEEMYDTPEKQDVIKRNAYKVYDGKDWKIGLANKAVAETGALQRMGMRKGQKIIDNYDEFYNMLNGPKVSPNTAEGHKYEKEITAAAEKYKLPPNLIASQMATESSNDPNAVGPKTKYGWSAKGLMQLGPEVIKEFGVQDVNDPAQNINAGAGYMRQLLDRYNGDLKKALAAYNAGPSVVDEYNGVPPYGETQGYVNKILKNLDQGESYYGRTADDTINTILEHWRGIANAKQGTTNANEDTKVNNQTTELNLKSRQLDQEDTKIAQKDKELAIKFRTEGTTATQKDLLAADDISKSLVEKYGGEDAFMQYDFSDPKEYSSALNDVIKIEALTGTKLSEADKKDITDLRSLISLSGDVSKLTVGETGIIDKNLGDLSNYFSDNIKGDRAKAAWAAFRNIYVHAMSGTAMTQVEAKRNQEALGNLGTKLGPAMEIFQGSLSQVRTRLDSAYSNMNPYSAKVRLGADRDKLIKVQQAIDNTLAYTQGLTSNPNAKASMSPEEKKATLDSIFGGK